jgi:hypothetical protein
MLQNEVSTQRKQDLNQQSFLENLNEAITFIDSLDKPGTNITQIDLRISEKLNKMQDMEAGFNTVNKNINKIIIQQLGYLHQKKVEIRKLKATAEDLAGIQAELQECKRNLQAANNDFQEPQN